MTRTLLAGVAAGTLLAAATAASAQTRLTIATVNNGDMIVMQRLSSHFEEQHPDIDLDWVVLEENVLRQRVTTDIATKGAQFDVMTIGTYEVPIWAKQNWLKPLNDLPAGYDVEDVLPPIREALSYQDTLYALPFYGESSMTFYRKDLFEQAGLTMPKQPSYDQIAQFAEKLHDPANQIYGICLRGKPGWGENMALLGTMVNTYGGQWFDMDWKPTIATPEWKQAVGTYLDLLKTYGPPGATSNGFNENLALFANGQCAMWIDATVAAGMLYNPATSRVADKVAFAQAPVGTWNKGNAWLWSWTLAIPASSQKEAAARQFITWATSQDYVQLVAKKEGWVSAPPGTRASTYARKEYQEVAPFAAFVLDAIQSADPVKTTRNPKPYVGIQYATIPEFQAIGTQVGQIVASALAGQTSVDQALERAQSTTERTMRQAGYR
ncbi:ABC transporter substrate-binding protein [Azospirillum sp. ST 5-10]|uniref:ABC transporter substrate-binding protein n=1 Tax=unclassified Azospirillum TaxID=2630922 RepID=UPI003F49B434